MNYSKFQDIDELKLALNNLLIRDVEVCLTELSNILGKKKRNDTLLYKMRWNDYAKTQNAGLATVEQLRVQKAQLVNEIMGYIEDLKDRHIKPEVIAELNINPNIDSEKDYLLDRRLPTLPIRQLENIEPVVALLVFANDVDDPLGNLKEEEREVQLALQHFKKAGGNIEIITLSSVTELFDYFTLYKGQIGLIHYGGHASGNGLHIDGTLANAQGLANLMGTEPNLQFVFLNGCATKDQVKLLEENKVRTVIATSVPVNDRKATNFAVRFYQNLTYFGGENTLEDAFKHAKAYIETTAMQPIEIKETRGFVFDDAKPISMFNWSLYGNPENWNWRLPKMGVTLKKNDTSVETVISTPNPVIPNNNLSDIERQSLERQKDILEKKIGNYNERLLSGGLSFDHQFAAEEAVKKMETQLAEIKQKLGL